MFGVNSTGSSSTARWNSAGWRARIRPLSTPPKLCPNA